MLDASIQAQVLELMVALKQESSPIYLSPTILGGALLCDRIAVMNAGRIVELGPTEEIPLTTSYTQTSFAGCNCNPV